MTALTHSVSSAHFKMVSKKFLAWSSELCVSHDFHSRRESYLTGVTLFVSATEIMASRLGDPDGNFVLAVAGCDILDHFLWIVTVVVHCHPVKVAVLARAHELFHPIFTSRTTGSGRTDEFV